MSRTSSFLNSLNFDTILWTTLGEHLLAIPAEEDLLSSLKEGEYVDGEEDLAFDAPGADAAGEFRVAAGEEMRAPNRNHIPSPWPGVDERWRREVAERGVWNENISKRIKGASVQYNEEQVEWKSYMQQSIKS